MTGQTTEFFIVDGGRPESARLLERAYNELYLPAFPAAEERDGLDVWLMCIARGKELIAVIAGENLADPEVAVLHGLSVAYYLPDANAGWMCYNVSDPKYRGKGLGRRLFDARVQALQDMARAQGHENLSGVYLELENPARVAEGQSSVDPAKRLSLYSGWGARVVPIDYIQPETTAGGERCRTLMLMAYPVEGLYPGPADVRRYLTALYRDDNEGINLAEDPDFLAMDRQIGEWKAREAAEGAKTGEIRAS